MTLRKLFRRFVAPRTTVFLLCVLAFLLLLYVVLPAEPLLGERRYARLLAESPLLRLLLVDLGLSHMPSSPFFLGALALFFLNLAAVVASRARSIWQRIDVQPRSARGLQAWARMERSLAAPLPEGFDARRAARTLRGFGYRVRRADDRTYWGLKHRTAPLGFLLFHCSFFLLCAGGVLIYYTRFVGTANLTEGQTFNGEFTTVLRRPPLAGPPPSRFTVDRVDPRFERGEPVHLGATFRFRRAGRDVTRPARVNHPARWGATRILVDRAGLSPVLWLQDENGFTLDQVVVPVKTLGGGEPTQIPLADDRVLILIDPLPPGSELPARADLPATSLRVQVIQQETLAFDGTLRPSQAADLPQGRLVLRELRYWVGIRLVTERGGGLLVAGFVAGIAGLVWRLLGYRRQLALDWDEDALRLVGRSEYFSWRFQEELKEIFAVLSESPGGPEPGDATAAAERRSR